MFNHLRFLRYQRRVTAVTACCCKLKKVGAGAVAQGLCHRACLPLLWCFA
ncbi:aldehyde dehydrogenase [Comamonas thiooxydans]|nr:aldehyde dehydrogenase [Comamonas thiooxydans]